jgi:hypothetical protein
MRVFALALLAAACGGSAPADYSGSWRASFMLRVQGMADVPQTFGCANTDMIHDVATVVLHRKADYFEGSWSPCGTARGVRFGWEQGEPHIYAMIGDVTEIHAHHVLVTPDWIGGPMTEGEFAGLWFVLERPGARRGKSLAPVNEWLPADPHPDT